MRPEGYENPHQPIDYVNGHDMEMVYDCPQRRDDFEAGADYMVEMMRKTGTHLTAEDHADPMYQLYFHTGQEPILPGTWVFIPDDKESE